MASKSKPAPGSVYPNGRGKWIAQEPANDEGKRPSETFDTEEAGWEHLKRIYARRIMRGGKPDKVNALALHVAITEWLGSRVIKEDTRDTYRQQLKKILAHPDALLPLREIESSHVENLIKAASPGNPRIKAFYRLGEFFRWAVRREYIIRDPFLFSEAEGLKKQAEGIAQTKRLETTGETWTLDEARAALAGIRIPYFRALVAFMLVTGVRRGEALGLSWGAVNGCTAKIARNRTSSSTRTVVVEELPKTGEIRTAHFGPHLAAMIEELRPARWKKDDYVFVSQKFGKPLTPRVVSRGVKLLVERMGFDDAGATHALRRTFATVLDGQGCPQIVREALLGHAGSRYAVPRTEELIRWAEIADKLFLDGLI
jgi:integrase